MKPNSNQYNLILRSKPNNEKKPSRKWLGLPFASLDENTSMNWHYWKGEQETVSFMCVQCDL